MNKKPSVPTLIREWLSSRDWAFGGEIARSVHTQSGQKEGVIERRCREGVLDGWLERRYVRWEQHDGWEGWKETDQYHGVVQYRLRGTTVPLRSRQTNLGFGVAVNK